MNGERLTIQVSLAGLGAGFVSASADKIPKRIPAHPHGSGGVQRTLAFQVPDYSIEEKRCQMKWL